MSSISSFDNVCIVYWEEESEGRWPDPKIILCIPASAVDTAVVNPNGIKTLLVNYIFY